MFGKKCHSLRVIAACTFLLSASSFPFGTALASSSEEKPTFVFSLSETGVWNNNPLMTRTNVQDIYGSETKASFGFQRETILSKIKAEIAVLRNQFDQSEYNSTDLYAKTNFEKTLERWLVSFAGSYNYDTTRSSEITTFGQNIGTGRRNSYKLQPSIFYMVSPRASIGVSANWLEIRYQYRTLTDYRVAALVPAFRYNVTPLQTATLSFQTQRFSILDNDNQYIDSLGPSLAWTYNFQPEWTLDLSAGTLASKQHGYAGTTGSSWDYNIIYGGSLRYNGLQHTAEFSAVRLRQPYSNGTEAYLTTIEASDKYAINENLDLEVKGNYQFAKQPSEITSALDSAWGGSVALGYELGPRWLLNASYKYREENLTNQSKAADQQIVRVGLTYQFGKR